MFFVGQYRSACRYFAVAVRELEQLSFVGIPGMKHNYLDSMNMNIISTTGNFYSEADGQDSAAKRPVARGHDGGLR